MGQLETNLYVVLVTDPLLIRGAIGLILLPSTQHIANAGFLYRS